MRQIFRAVKRWWHDIWHEGDEALLADLPPVIRCVGDTRSDDPIKMDGWELSDYTQAPLWVAHGKPGPVNFDTEEAPVYLVRPVHSYAPARPEDA